MGAGVGVRRTVIPAHDPAAAVAVGAEVWDGGVQHGHRVTAVARSPEKAEAVRALGAIAAAGPAR